MDKRYYNEETKEIFIPKDEPKLFEDGLGCLIYEKLKLHQNKILQIDAKDAAEDTGASLLKRSIRTAMEMKARGIKENDVITVCSHNHINAIVPVIAATFIGAIPANLDPSFSQDDLTHLLNLVESKLVFTSPDKFEAITSLELQCNPEIISFSDTNDTNSFNSFLQEFENENQFLPTKRSIDDLAVILFSSGTSGLSKGACIPARTVMYHCQESSPRTMLVYTSLYWISSYHISMYTLISGGTRILCSEFDPTTSWELFAKFKVDFVLLNPAKVAHQIQHKPKVELPHLKIIAIGGSFVCMDHFKKIKELVPNTTVMIGYAQTESWKTFEVEKPLKSGNYESIGIPCAGRVVKVVDLETGEAQGFNKPGELRVKSKYMTTGYYKNDYESKNAFDSDGFFKTGDVCYYDENFCFYIVDRTKEMFKYRGWQVIPAKIENILRKHLGVLDAVAVGIPNVLEENLTLAFVIPKINSELEPEEVKNFANNLLDDIHKIRVGVKIVNEFPFTPSGKVLRRKLIEMYLSNKI